MIQVATPEDIETIVERKLAEFKDDITYELSFIGKSQYIGLGKVAEELGYHRDTASRWLREHPEIQVFNNGRKLRIHRKDFYDTLRNQ